MRITYLCSLIRILTIGCVALMPRTGFADPAQQASTESRANGNSASRTVAHSPGALSALDAHDGAAVEDGKSQERAAASRSKKLSHNRKPSTPRSVTHLHRPASEQSAGARRDGLVKNGTASKVASARASNTAKDAANNTLPVRSPSLVRHSAPSIKPSFNNVRHRGPNPAAVDGTMSLSSSDSGSLNGTNMGTRMQRRR
ncbi:MAG TPA: hypothetical protein VN946_01315 [Terriglobales bacterium]|jgi:hypothetical protein|nr:hypothetical protein [Terriglobales bacterium]